MKQQPEALRLADALMADNYGAADTQIERQAAAELRRLHDLLGKANAVNRVRAKRVEELEAEVTRLRGVCDLARDRLIAVGAEQSARFVSDLYD